MGRNSHKKYCIIFMEVTTMDQIKTGKFIAKLRKQSELTQEALGEKIGITNKTISRWETGNYMPDIDMLQLLSKEFDVSINELLAGEKMSEEKFRKKADENIVAVSKASAFTLQERTAYFKRKWHKEHIFLFVILGIILTMTITLPLAFGHPEFIGLSPLVALIEYGYQNNKMMIYVENNLYH